MLREELQIHGAQMKRVPSHRIEYRNIPATPFSTIVKDELTALTVFSIPSLRPAGAEPCKYSRRTSVDHFP